MKGLVIVITLYVASFMITAELVEPGSFRTSSEKITFLTDVELGPEDVVPLGFIFHRVTVGVTILIMVLSELSAHLMRLSSTTPVHPLGPNNDLVIEKIFLFQPQFLRCPWGNCGHSQGCCVQLLWSARGSYQCCFDNSPPFKQKSTKTHRITIAAKD